MIMVVPVQNTLCMRFGAAPRFVAGSKFVRDELDEL